MFKKIFFCFLLCSVCFSAQAQVRFSTYFGRLFPNLSNLNTLLTQNGFDALKPSSNCTGVSIVTATDDFVEIMMDGFFATQFANQNNNKGYTFQTGGLGLNVGFRVINKYKTTLTPFLGVAWSPASTLRIRNGNPPSGNTPIAGQLQAPANQLIELTHTSPFYLNIGVQAKFKIRKLSMGLKVGYYGRLSKTKWTMTGQRLSEAPTINPLGFQTALMIGF